MACLKFNCTANFNCQPPTTHYPLPPAPCPLPTAHCQLPTAHCPLPPASCQLPTAHCLMPTANSQLTLSYEILYFCSMRVMAILLTMLILTMSGIPCCSSEMLCEDAGIVISDNPVDSHDEDPHPEGPCSPFYTCGTCPGVVQTSEFVFQPAVELPIRVRMNTFQEDTCPEPITFRLLRPPILGFC